VTTARPLRLQKRQVDVERALAGPEDVGAGAAANLAELRLRPVRRAISLSGTLLLTRSAIVP
jgi:hypothetical protein